MHEVPPWQRDARIVSAATAYAKLGFEVLPLHGIVDGACACGNPDCGSPGKHPALDGGFHGATSDVPTVEAWFQKRANANLGLRPPPLIVFDIDPRNGGDESWDRWIAKHGECPDTVEVITGSGGRHIYLRAEQPIKNQKLGGDYFGIDVICATGYVVAPPSKHISGRRYEWEGDFDLAELQPLDGDPFAQLPSAWLSALQVATVQNVAPGNREAPILSSPPVGEFERVRAALFTLSADSYHDWIQYGQILHQTCWHGSFELWCEWSQTSDRFKDENDCRRKWLSFDKNGAAGLGTLFSDASSLGRQADTPQPPAVPTNLIVPFKAMTERITATPCIVKDLWPAEGVILVYGESGQGKTFYALDGALHVATGREWCGQAVERGPVIYVNGEGKNGFAKRLRGWQIHHNVSDVELENFYGTTSSVPLTDPAWVDALLTEAKAIEPTLVVVDTLARNFGGADENSTKDMTLFVQQLERLQNALGCAVLVVHHTSKGDKESPRGNGALRAAIDAEFRVEREPHQTRVTNTKQRDLDAYDDLAFQPLTIEFSATAEDEEPVSTLVFVWQSGGATEQVIDLITPQQRELLELICTMQAETRERLNAMGRQDELAWVSRRELGKRTDMDSTTLRVQLSRLKASGRVSVTRHDVRIEGENDALKA